MNIRAYEDGDENHLAHLLRLHCPDIAMSPERVRQTRALQDKKYLSEVFFAFSEENLLGCIRYHQHAYEYHPNHFHLSLFLNRSVPFLEVGKALYRHVTNALAVYQPQRFLVTLDLAERDEVQFFTQQGFEELTRLYHMSADLQTIPELTFPPSDIKIECIDQFLASSPELQEIYQVEVETAADIPFGSQGHHPTFEEYVRRMTNPSIKRQTLVARKNGVCVGFCYLRPSDCENHIYLGGTGVSSQARRSKVGLSLKHAAFVFARKNGFKFLHSDNHATNEAIVELNLKCGFTIARTEAEYKKDFSDH